MLGLGLNMCREFIDIILTIFSYSKFKGVAYVA
jgi:hypothetical protein